MSIRILYHQAARRDVSLSFVYLGKRNIDAANRLLATVESDLEKLAEMPGMGSIRNFAHPSLADVRSWPLSGFSNYLIFYRVRGDLLHFMRFIYGARDIEAALLNP